MTQSAQVIALIDENRAKVRVERMSACGHDCSTCEGCGLQSASIEAVANNPVGAKVGDTVLVESSSKEVLRLASLTYLLPVVLFFVLFFVLRALGVSESASAIGAILGFGCGLFGAVFGNRKGQIDTTIVGIVEQSEC
ncbi:MAG: hypothetical protein E7471_02290 [Ruminococcaceae bacterium]|nr:hypothetical protein [Oscillospiraceae bacterium]